MKRISICIYLWMLSTTLFARVPQMPVAIAATTNDSVGSQLVYFVKQDLQASKSLTLTLGTGYRIQLEIVTIEQYPNNPGISTVYSVVITWINPKNPFPLFLNSYVGYCGASRVRNCAQNIVAKTSEQSDELIRLVESIGQHKQ